MNISDEIEFPKDNIEAEKRFNIFRSNDPFPEIPPALLNSADIYDYVRCTGMVHPFEASPDSDKLKSASYEIGFLGDLHIINDSGKYEITPIKLKEHYMLPSNSISFLFLETMFWLPDYIAARFNLHISLVHAGLLLGTGPLIDPGFSGRLLIPLHNLTSENLNIKGGDGLIWVEFTKLSPNRLWVREQVYSQEGTYRQFPERKTAPSAEKYLRKARPTSPVPARSSIPIEIKKSSDKAASAADDARKAQNSAKNTEELSKKILYGGALALALSLAGILAATWNLISTANKNIVDFRNEANFIKANQDSLLKKVESLEAELQKIQKPANPGASNKTPGLGYHKLKP